MYRGVTRWIVQCVACGREGYDRAMPTEARGAVNLSRMLEPLEVGDRALSDPGVVIGASARVTARVGSKAEPGPDPPLVSTRLAVSWV